MKDLYEKKRKIHFNFLKIATIKSLLLPIYLDFAKYLYFNFKYSKRMKD